MVENNRLVKLILGLSLVGSLASAAYYGTQVIRYQPSQKQRPAKTATPHHETGLEARVKLPYDTYVIDAGHGGNDSGATSTIFGGGDREKDLVLPIAVNLANEIRTHSYSKPVLTRAKDETMKPEERAKIANKYAGKNARFISLHVNKGEGGFLDLFSNSKPEGVFVLYSDRMRPIEIPYLDLRFRNENYDKMEQIDRPILHELGKSGLKIHGGKKNGFRSVSEVRTDDVYILDNIELSMLPALYELGFIENPSDVAVLKDPARIAKAIFNGLAKGL